MNQLVQVSGGQTKEFRPKRVCEGREKMKKTGEVFSSLGRRSPQKRYLRGCIRSDVHSRQEAGENYRSLTIYALHQILLRRQHQEG